MEKQKLEINELCNLLECKENELIEFDDMAASISYETKSMCDSLLKILQKGCNIREATLIGLLIGRNIGYLEAEKKMEDEIKDRLYNAFRGNNPHEL